jgi:hypothetical protein
MPIKPDRDKSIFSTEVLQDFFDEYVIVGRVKWKSPAERKTAYFKHRDFIISEFIFSNPHWPLYGCRPDAFWSYEHPDHYKLNFGNWREKRLKSFAFLKEKGLLLLGEEADFNEQTKEIKALLDKNGGD